MARDFRNKIFQKTLRGYAMAEVDEYIAYVAGEYRKLEKKASDTEKKLSAALRRIDDMSMFQESSHLDSEAEAHAKTILDDARERAEEIVAEAQSRVNETVAKAERRARDIVAEAERRADRILEEAGERTKLAEALTKRQADSIAAAAQQEAEELMERVREEAEAARQSANEAAEAILREAEAATRRAEEEAGVLRRAAGTEATDIYGAAVAAYAEIGKLIDRLTPLIPPEEPEKEPDEPDEPEEPESEAAGIPAEFAPMVASLRDLIVEIPDEEESEEPSEPEEPEFEEEPEEDEPEEPADEPDGEEEGVIAFPDEPGDAPMPEVPAAPQVPEEPAEPEEPEPETIDELFADMPQADFDAALMDIEFDDFEPETEEPAPEPEPQPEAGPADEPADEPIPEPAEEPAEEPIPDEEPTPEPEPTPDGIPADEPVADEPEAPAAIESDEAPVAEEEPAADAIPDEPEASEEPVEPEESEEPAEPEAPAEPENAQTPSDALFSLDFWQEGEEEAKPEPDLTEDDEALHIDHELVHAVTDLKNVGSYTRRIVGEHGVSMFLLTARRPAVVQPFDDVKDIARKRLVAQREYALADEAASQLALKALELKDAPAEIEELVKSLKGSWHAEVTKTRYDIEGNPYLPCMNEILTTDVGKLSSPDRQFGFPAFVFVTAHTPATAEEIAEKKETLARELKYRKQEVVSRGLQSWVFSSASVVNRGRNQE